MSQESDAESARSSFAEACQLLAEMHQLMGQLRIVLDRFSDSPPLQSAAQLDPAETARQIIRLRRKRDKLFSGLSGREVFGEPAWEMLLDLFVAKMRNKRVGVSSLCIASNGPSTTALRYITIMTQQGILVRTPDEHDNRRVFITLSEWAFGIMEEILIN